MYIYIWYPLFLTFWTLQLMAFSGDQKLHFSKSCEKLGSWILDFAKKAFRMHSSPNLRSTIQDSKSQKDFLNPRG